jgi:hypothetical protein
MRMELRNKTSALVRGDKKGSAFLRAVPYGAFFLFFS